MPLIKQPYLAKLPRQEKQFYYTDKELLEILGVAMKLAFSYIQSLRGCKDPIPDIHLELFKIRSQIMPLGNDLDKTIRARGQNPPLLNKEYPSREFVIMAQEQVKALLTYLEYANKQLAVAGIKFSIETPAQLLAFIQPKSQTELIEKLCTHIDQNEIDDVEDEQMSVADYHFYRSTAKS